jgi:hypothetical protein
VHEYSACAHSHVTSRAHLWDAVVGGKRHEQRVRSGVCPSRGRVCSDLLPQHSKSPDQPGSQEEEEEEEGEEEGEEEEEEEEEGDMNEGRCGRGMALDLHRDAHAPARRVQCEGGR